MHNPAKQTNKKKKSKSKEKKRIKKTKRKKKNEKKDENTKQRRKESELIKRNKANMLRARENVRIAAALGVTATEVGVTGIEDLVITRSKLPAVDNVERHPRTSRNHLRCKLVWITYGWVASL